MVEGSVDSELVEEVEAREELHGSGSQGFDNDFDIRVWIHNSIVKNSCIRHFDC